MFKIFCTDINGNDVNIKTEYKKEYSAAKKVNKLLQDDNIKGLTVYEFFDYSNHYYQTVFTYEKHDNSADYYRYNGFNFEYWKNISDHQNKLALNEIYRNINNGYCYQEYIWYVKYIYFNTVLSLTHKNNIFWQNYGSSCNKNTIDELNWIITVIFKMTPYEFKENFILSKN